MTIASKNICSIGIFSAPTNSDLGNFGNPDSSLRDFHVKELAPIIEDLLSHHETNEIVAVGPGMKKFLALRAQVGMKLSGKAGKENVEDLNDEVNVTALAPRM